VADVGRVERRGLRRHPAREVGVADDLDAVRSLDRLLGHRQVAVAAALGGEVDDDRARLHHLDHVGGPELRRRSARDEGRGDDDVHLRRELAELGELLLAELWARGRGIAAGRSRVLGLLEFEEDELGAHRLDLLGDLGADVEGVDDGAERDRGADRREAGDAGANDEHLGGRHLAGGGHLAGEEAAEVVAGLDDRAVAGDVRHRGEGIHLLGAADARHHVHGERSDALCLQGLEEFGVLSGIEEGDDDLPGAGHLDLGRLGRADLGDDIGLCPEVSGGRDNGHAGLAVGLVREAGGQTGARLDEALVPELLQRQGGLRRQRDPLLALDYLLRCSDLHYRSVLRLGAIDNCTAARDP
jgi:hypothetical protein